MYPKGLLQNTTAISDQHSDILQSYYANLSSYHDLISFGHEFDNIAYNIIPFVSMSITWLLFSYNISPATSIGVLIYLRHDKMKINLKLNKIKVIPHQSKMILKHRYFVCMTPTNHEKHIIFLHFVW